jgi:hypothetical protein
MTLFGLRMKNQQQAGESSVMRNFMICSRAWQSFIESRGQFIWLCGFMLQHLTNINLPLLLLLFFCVCVCVYCVFLHMCSFVYACFIRVQTINAHRGYYSEMTPLFTTF